MIPNLLNLRILLKYHIIAIIKFIFFKINIFEARNLNLQWKPLLNSKSDKIVVILAGGPSLDNKLIDCLKNNREKIEIIAINRYHKNSSSDVLIPDYYIISDPDLLSDDPVTKKNNIELIDYINATKAKLICPNNKNFLSLNQSYIPFNDLELLLSNNIDPRNPRGYPSNTAFKALAIAIALGYECIYILGFDYDYVKRIFLDENNKLLFENIHHYNTTISDYSVIFESVAHALHWWSLDYHHLKKLYSSKIHNVTNNSLVDTFNRISPKEFSLYLDSY
tara:strand:- start:1608 stop:2444 length:837 start_codon:yes stop_codon:yes gene_type:complete